MQIVYTKVDAVVELARARLTPQGFERVEDSISAVADKGSVVAAGVILLAGVVSGAEIGAVLASIVAVFLLGYVGHKFSNACRVAVNANRSSVSTSAYFDLLALILMLGIVGGVLFGIYTMFDGFDEGLYIVFASLTGLIMLVYTLHPSMIAVDIDPNSSAGRDLLSVLAIYIKGALRTVNLLSALYIVGGILLVAYGVILEAQGEWGAEAVMGSGTMVILAAMALPALAYLMFIVLYFFIDLFENLLSMKGVERRLSMLVAGARKHSSPPATPAAGAPPGPAT